MGKLWEHSNQIEWHSGAVAAGAKAYFFEGNTTTPLTTYSDGDETTPRTHPVEADGNGRWPAIFIPFIASYDVKVTTSGGTQLYYPTDIPNPDPVEASEDSVDPSELIATGDVIFRHGGGTRTGFVRANGRTVGSAASGATERANADTEPLYTYLWNGFANGILAVATGRGASAAADFAANKAIALFDMRSGIAIGVDDMGNSAASRAGSIPYTNGNSTTAGSHCGENTHALVTGELAAHTHGAGSYAGDSGGAHTHTGTTGNQSANHTHSGTTSTQSADHTHAVPLTTTPVASGGGASGVTGGTTATGGVSADHTHTVTTGTESATHTHAFTTDSGGAHTHTISGSSASAGSGTAHNVVSYGTSGTFYVKL